MILAVWDQIPLWDMGAGPSDETFKLKFCVAAGVAIKRTVTAKSNKG
jgi:hypothetical protein